MATPSSRGDRRPALFVGHGNPMNALERNAFTDAWHEHARAARRGRPRHYLPLLYVIAQRLPDDPIEFPVQGFAVRIGR